MQFRIPFDTFDEGDEPPLTPPAANGPHGLLSGRPWFRPDSPAAQLIDQLRREMPVDFAVSDCLLEILACRGLTDFRRLESFFYPSLGQLPDPFHLKEMDLAAERVLTAVKREEKVAVHGDFDVDGLTGCALLTELLQNLRWDGRRANLQASFVPDRCQDGYGVAGRMVRHWAQEGVTLLVTVDTGAAAHNEIALARNLGLDVVVLDHHIFQKRPQAVALVNPRRPDAVYPNQDLCGVGVAFKLVQALRKRVPTALPAGFEEEILDLVCLGLVADQMPLCDENRILVRKGLSRLEDLQNLRPGLAALLGVAGLDRGFPVTTSDLAFQVAPRLNACGRIGRVNCALELLLTRDPAAAARLAAEADRTNQRRKAEDKALREEAAALAAPYVERGDRGLVLASPEWHKGIIGIGAARLVELFQVPTVLIAVEGDEARGSVRSVPALDVKAVLDHCSEWLVQYGGHAQAAGMTLRTEDLAAFRTSFLSALATLPANGPAPQQYDLDLPLETMSAGDVADLMAELEQMEPFGPGNRRPVFRGCGYRMLRPPVPVGNGNHLRFTFAADRSGSQHGSPALGRSFVAFGVAESWHRAQADPTRIGGDPLQQHWDILFKICRSTYRPRVGSYDPVQQQLIDLQPSRRP